MDIKKIFGFTKHGRSLIGKKLSAAQTNKSLRKFFALFLIAGIFTAVIFPNLSMAANIGGVPIINVTPSTRLIDINTKVTVRVPVETLYISQRFGWFHSGLDLVTHTGTPVYPMMDGVVSHTEEVWYGYGHQVIVDHGAGFSTLYGHLSKILVSAGQKVDINTELGKSGSTGFSTGPHLHLELRQNGHAIDPAELLPEIVTK